MEYKTTVLYNWFFIVNDTLIAAAPILILNVEINQLNNNWYFFVIFLATISCVDPFLSLLFSMHKFSSDRRKLYTLKIITSVFLVFVSLGLPMQRSSEGLSVEQSNDLFFMVFSTFCFLKLTTAFDELLQKSRVIQKVVSLLTQLWPFLVKLLTVFALSSAFYALCGQLLFGGKMNSFSISYYQKETKLKLKETYKYFHFNDTFSAFLTLFALLVGNNWLYVVEHLFSVNKSFLTTFFVVTYNFFVVFMITALLMGTVCRLIIVYFEDDFSDLEGKALKRRSRALSVAEQELLNEEEDD